MRYQLAPLYCRPWTLNGISARLIESHYENNYGAAPNRLNAISEEIERLDLGNAPNPSLARLKRDEIVALNSTLLHELYFASLGGDGRVVPDALASAIAKDFGSVDRWRQEFVGIAAGLAGGSGWVLLTYVPRRTAHQSDLLGAQPKHRGRRPDTRPRYVRACLPPGIRRERWNSARTQAPTSLPSCATSTGPP
jgi:superoxide dismutase